MGVNGIYGLSGSGLDVESMVKVGMLSKQNELEKMQQKYTLNEWKKTEYLDLYSEVQTFNNSTLSQYKLSSTMNARSANSSNDAVSVTANATAAPMQHYVEVGQLASAAYLIGTQSVTRIGETTTKDSNNQSVTTVNENSTKLQDALFKTLTKGNDGKYTFVDSNGKTTDGLSANDVAFTFRIGDGTKNNTVVLSTNENIFTASAVSGTSDTAIHSIKVDMADPPVMTTNSGTKQITSATKMQDAFASILKANDDPYINLRLNRLANDANIKNNTAFTIKFFDQNTSDDLGSIDFKYSDLTRTDITFVDFLNAKLSGSNVSVSLNTNGSLSFTNTKATGSDSYIQFSLTGNVDLGASSANSNLSIYPIDSSTLNVNTTVKAAFARLLSNASNNTDGFNSATRYIEAHSDSSEIAFTFNITDENNQSVDSFNVTFAEMSQTAHFKDFINSKLGGVFDKDDNNNIYGVNTVGGELKVRFEGNKLIITDGQYGAGNKLTVTPRLDEIGEINFEYPLSYPSDVAIYNQTISAFVSNKFGMDATAQNQYITTLRNAGSDLGTTPAFQLKISDGVNQDKIIDIFAADFTDTSQTIWTKIKDNLPSNISGTLNGNTNTITLTNRTIGTDSKIEFSFAAAKSLVTQAMAKTTGTNEATTLQDLLNIDISRLKFKNETESATADVLTLTYNDGNSSNTVGIKFTELDKNLVTLLNQKLPSNLRAKLGVDENNQATIIVSNTATGEASSITALSFTSKIDSDIGTYPAEISQSITGTDLNQKLSEFIGLEDAGAWNNLATGDASNTTAFSVSFSDGSTTSSVDITWGQLAANGGSNTAVSDVLTALASNLNENATHIKYSFEGNTIKFNNENVYTDAKIAIGKSSATTGATYASDTSGINLSNYFTVTTETGKTTLTFTGSTDTVRAAFGITADSVASSLATNTNTAYTFKVNSGTEISFTWQELFSNSGNDSISDKLFNKLKMVTGTGITPDAIGANKITFTNNPPSFNISSSSSTPSGITTVNWTEYYGISTNTSTTTITLNGNSEIISTIFNIDADKAATLKENTETAFSITVGDTEVAKITWEEIESNSDNTIAQLLQTKLPGSLNLPEGITSESSNGTNTFTLKNEKSISIEENTADSVNISYSASGLNLANLFSGITSTTGTVSTVNTSAITGLFSTVYKTGATYNTPNELIINSETGTTPFTGGMIENNLKNLFGAQLDGDDGGTKYSQGLLIDRIGDFFGGSAYNSQTNTASIAGQSGSAIIDGTTHELNRANSNTWHTETFDYKFKADGSGFSNVINSGETISITYEQLANGYTFNDLVSEINSLGMNVRATYDSVQDRFSIYNKESGAENLISIGFDSVGTDSVMNSALTRTATFFTQMGLKQTENGVLDTDTGTGNDLTQFDFEFATGKTSILAGKNAVVKIDGIDYNNLAKNNLTVNGVNYTFNSVTNSNVVPTGEKDSNGNDILKINPSSTAEKTTVNISQDTAAIASKVKSFVEEYNTILKKLYEWYDEKPNEKYKPLTASQKEGMKDEQIEKWEEKAKAGMLYHDKTLFSIINQMRSVISEKIEGITGNYNTIFSLGVSTTGTKGQLKLDEDKLNAALANDPDAVYNIFSKLDKGETQYLVELDNGTQIWTTDTSRGTPVEKDGKTVTKTVERASYNGIAQRLSDILNTGMKSLKTVAGSSGEITEDSDLNNLLRDLQTKMSNFQRMMQAFETRLYKKYDAMESALALLGAQLNYVTGAFQ